MNAGRLVRLRAPEFPDFEKYAEWANNVEVWENLGEGPIFESNYIVTLENADNKYLRWLSNKNSRLFSIETLDGTLIGYCGLIEMNWTSRCSEMGIVIGHPGYWGQGYGADAIDLLMDISFNGYGLHRVDLHVSALNERGRRCYEKCGFQTEAVFRDHYYVHGTYCDAILMSLLENTYRALKSDRSVTLNSAV